mmetsp:Transcript_18960/g.62344  ORF Transcript_18960/g.62344 Transcript_18960/m.62344 type:complete len:251 (+) Transcript_18960:2388-3140(+)
MLFCPRPAGLELLQPLCTPATHRQVLEERARAGSRATRGHLQDAPGEEEDEGEERRGAEQSRSAPAASCLPRPRRPVNIRQSLEEGAEKGDAASRSENPVCRAMLESARRAEAAEDVLDGGRSAAEGEGVDHPIQCRQEDTGSDPHVDTETRRSPSPASSAGAGRCCRARASVPGAHGEERLQGEEDGEEAGSCSYPPVRLPRASGEADAQDSHRPVVQDPRAQRAKEKASGRRLHPACLLRTRGSPHVC